MQLNLGKKMRLQGVWKKQSSGLDTWIQFLKTTGGYLNPSSSNPELSNQANRKKQDFNVCVHASVSSLAMFLRVYPKKLCSLPPLRRGIINIESHAQKCRTKSDIALKKITNRATLFCRARNAPPQKKPGACQHHIPPVQLYCSKKNREKNKTSSRKFSI